MRVVQKLLSLETSPQRSCCGGCSMGGSGVGVQPRNIPAMHGSGEPDPSETKTSINNDHHELTEPL